MMELDDQEFLNYLNGMLETPDCGVVPAHMARLFRLAGNEHAAAMWDKQPLQVIRKQHQNIRNLIKQARDSK